MVKTIALIPARSGSKRIPDKNIRILGGHPMMAYSICSALECGLFDKVLVSTDSEKYAKIARHYGAEVPFLRPAEIAGEHSPDIEWVRDTLIKLAASGEEYDVFSLLRPTSPFRSIGTIRRAFEKFKKHPEVDSLRAVEKCRQHPGKMWKIENIYMQPLLTQEHGQVPMHSTPMAALPAVYVQNASLEIAHTRVVFQEGSIAGSRILPFFTEGFEGLDINDEQDFFYAQYLIENGKAYLPAIEAAVYSS